MKVIGLTGGIGSGKSTVAAILKESGAEIVDADNIAREVIKEPEILSLIYTRFGEDLKTTDGNLDRVKLAKLVFSDKEALIDLNSIMHPIIADKISSLIESIKKKGIAKLIVLDAPVPLEHGFLDISDEIWVVSTDKDTRISRVTIRNQLSYDEVNERINSQSDDKTYTSLAERIIFNNGSKIELSNAVKRILKDM